MKDLIRRLRPETFDEIIALLALYRPGPLGSGMVDDFIKGKHGKGGATSDLPQLKEILGDTHGVILYQEQVMKIASALANFSLSDADILRRAMGKKKSSEMQKQQEKFMEGAKKNKISQQKAQKIFELMLNLLNTVSINHIVLRMRLLPTKPHILRPTILLNSWQHCSAARWIIRIK